MNHHVEMYLIQAGLPVCGWIGTYYVGKRKSWGWFLQVLGQLIWIVYTVATGQFGMPLGTIVYLYLYFKNGTQWRKEDKKRDSAQGAQEAG
jgi:hypothetical protein